MIKQKILHVTFDMEMGGAEQVIRQLVENSDKSRFESIVLCLDGKVGVLGKEIEKKGFKTLNFHRSPGLDRALIRKIRAYIRDENIDVVHCHQYSPYIYGLLASFGTSAKVIFTEHGRFYPDSYKWKRYLLNPFLSLFTDEVICISKATADALVKYENFPKRKVKVVYNGIKDKQIKLTDDELNIIKKELGITETNIVMGTISRLDPIKNQKMMITAFEKVLGTQPNAKLLIIGDGPERVNLEKHTEALGLEESIIFTGFIVNPQRYFGLMDIFLLPSLSEGTSMTLLEAMAFSIPCIVTNVGGNPEIIENNDSGLVVPNDDAKSLSEAMLSLNTNKELAIRLGDNGNKRFQSFFTIENMVNAYQHIYKTM